MPKFDHDWFSPNIPNLTKWLAELKDKPVRALEIGCFEGRSTCWFLENILTHPESSITVIDTFEGSREHREKQVDFSSALLRFAENTQQWRNRVHLIQNRSQEALRHLGGSFDFAYVDGSHVAPDVLSDACLLWPLIANGGLVVFDDYLWTGWGETSLLHTPHPAVDAFLHVFSESYDLIGMAYQVCIRKRAT